MRRGEISSKLLICNPDAKTNWFHLGIHFSRLTCEACRNMKEPLLSLLLEETPSISLVGNRFQGSWYVGESSNRPRVIKRRRVQTGHNRSRGKVPDRQNLTYDRIKRDTQWIKQHEIYYQQSFSPLYNTRLFSESRVIHFCQQNPILLPRKFPPAEVYRLLYIQLPNYPRLIPWLRFG